MNDTGEFGIMDGTVRDVPSLQAPGFIKAVARGHFNDVSDSISGDLILNVRSSTPEYSGFRVSFAAGALSPDYACAGGSTIPFTGGCYKRKFTVPSGSEFVEIRLPFNTFSDHWSPYTGDQITTCAEDPSVCPTARDLSHIQHIELWAEGAKGDVRLEVHSISAEVSDSSHREAEEIKKTVLAKIANDYDSSAYETSLVTFDGAELTTFTFHQTNDPVMVRKNNNP